MSALLLRGPFVRSNPKLVWGLSRKCGRSNLLRNPRRQQSSSSSSPPSSNPSNAPESAAQTQATPPPQPGPQIAQQGTAQARPQAKIDPIPGPNIVAPLPFWQRLGPLTRAGQAYARAQRARPWATQVASALVIYLCADFGAQRLGSAGSQNVPDDSVEEGRKRADGGDGSREEGRRHDWARTARSLAIGGTAAIPGFIWYSFLSRSFNYSSRVLSIAVKVAVNQLTFTPLFSVYFFGAQALLSGDSPAEAWRRVSNTVPVSFVNSCKLWPAVTAFSFAFVPFEYRSVFGGVVAVGWQTYLSFLNRRAETLESLRQGDHAVRPGAIPLLERPSAAVWSVQELPAAKQAVMG
ncbi:hypothetical protein GGS24DRAFT_37974 [Hypoxylon argillaceum]|nr:hypothetical protein GGS24DRAFT_37974 [Hypoxylon argillaceum]